MSLRPASERERKSRLDAVLRAGLEKDVGATAPLTALFRRAQRVAQLRKRVREYEAWYEELRLRVAAQKQGFVPNRVEQLDAQELVRRSTVLAKVREELAAAAPELVRRSTVRQPATAFAAVLWADGGFPRSDGCVMVSS